MVFRFRGPPARAAEFHLSHFAQAALSSGVQVDFVIGCLGGAFLGLPDRVDPRRLFAASAAVAALANAGLPVVDPASLAAPLLRVLTGLGMAGVYRSASSGQRRGPATT